jgi:hypothetical protein
MEARPGLRSFVPWKQWREIIDFLNAEHPEVSHGGREAGDLSWEPSCGEDATHNVDPLRVSDEKKKVRCRFCPYLKFFSFNVTFKQGRVLAAGIDEGKWCAGGARAASSWIAPCRDAE